MPALNKRFITFEGLEGVGKSTQIQIAERHLQAQGVQVWVTREPGGTQLGEDLRTILLQSTQIDAMTELLLLFAARRQHLVDKILPALEAGYVVLCDRFTDTSFAYQGGGRGLDWAFISQLEHAIQGTLRPALTFLLDAPVTLSLSRMQKRRKDRFEREDQNFFQSAREAFLKRAASEPARFRVLDATLSLKALQLQIQQYLHDHLS